MLKLLLLSGLFLVILSAEAQTKDATVIRKILSTQTTAWNEGNIERFMNGYWRSDSLMFIGKNGPTYGWNKTLANYKKNYPDTTSMGKLQFDLITVNRLSDLYYSVVGKWRLKRSIGDVGGVFTLLFKRIKKQWVIIQDHSS